MGKSISLTGAAAKAFLGLAGNIKGEKTEDDRLMEVATAIFLKMKLKDHKGAVELLKAFRSDSMPVG